MIRRPTTIRVRLDHVAQRARATALLLALAVAPSAPIAGCGGTSAPQRTVTGPFSAEHAAVFENGVDYIADPTRIDGSWLREWEQEIDARVSLADAIGLVTITTLRTDVDLDRRETLRLVAHVDRERHGDLPDELTLVVRPGQPGYSTVHGNDRRILDQRFVLFVKWAEEDGTIVPRWHLSPAAERVVRRVNTLVERRHTPVGERRRVIVREHDVEGGGADDGEDDEGL